MSDSPNAEPHICPHCGAALPNNASFCPECGRRIEKQPDKVFCTQCGAELKKEAKFCPECGTPAATPKKSAPEKEKPKAPKKERPHGGVGYSKVINDPAFLKGVKQEKSARRGCVAFLAIAPIVIAPVYTHFSDGLSFGKGFLLGAAISAAILLISFLASLKERLEKPFDGVVEKRYEKRVCVNEGRENDRDSRWETHYFVILRKDGGGKHKIEEDDMTSYSYLKEGDRVRYHGRMGLLYPYEKYDKSHDAHVICAFCRRSAPITDDVCPNCKKPLLK